MFSWQENNYLLVVDRMSGYIIVENLAKSALCRTVTQKFKLLCMTYGHPRQVRYDKGPQFGREFEELFLDICITPTPSSANNPALNGLAESAVESMKILLRKSIEEKSNYPELMCHFNTTPREEEYFPSELFHGRKLRTYLPTLDDTLEIDKGKALREITDMIAQNSSQTYKPLKALEKGDLCYRREFDGKNL